MKVKLLSVLFAFLFIAVFSCESKAPKEEADTAVNLDSIYLEKGRLIASSTFAALSGKLQAALKEGGVANAVEYCNLAAYPLVDSLAKVHQADIRRTSLQVRNLANLPTPLEKTILEEYQNRMQAGEALQPVIQELEGGRIAFYAPIQINALCLQCHGKVGDTLNEENYAVIRKLYPTDQAIGYAEGDLRGIWSIQFKKEQGE